MSPWLLGPPVLLTIVIATLVLSGGPGRSDNRAFFASAILAVLHNIAAGYAYFEDPVNPPVLETILSVFALLWLTSTALFAYSFPNARPAGALRVWGVSIAAFIVGLGHVTLPRPFGELLYRAFALGAIGLTLTFLLGAPRRLEGRKGIQGVRLVQLVIIARLLLGGLVHGILTQFDTRAGGLAAAEMSYVPALTSAFIAYALLRYQLLDVRFFISRSLGLFIVTGGTAVAFVGILELLQRAFRFLGLNTWGGEGGLIAPGLLMLLILSFNPLRLRLETWLEARVNRGLVRAREAAALYFEQTEGVLDVPHLLEALDRAVGAILPKGAAAIVINRPSPRIIATPGFTWPGKGGVGAPFPEAPFPEGPPAAQALHARGKPFYALGADAPLPELAPFAAVGADLVVPFAVKDRAAGALLCQAGGWEVERVELLVQVSRHLGLQLENALLYREALDANQSLRATNAELAEIRSFLEAVVAAMPVGLAVVDRAGGLTEMNPALGRILGAAPEDWLSRGALPPALTALGALDALEREVEATRGDVSRRTLHIDRGAGPEARQLNLRVAPIASAEGQPRAWVLLVSDVTDFVRLQGDLEDSRRLAALGTLAAAMAHEIRTPLTSIKLNLQILGGKLLELPEGDREYFDIALQELERLNQYVTEILDFARPLSLARSPLRPLELVDEVRRSLYFLLAEREVELALEGDWALEAEVDGERLKQVIINLIDNASQALEEGGGGVVRVQVSPEARPLPDRGRVPGLALTVADTGPGMDAATLAQIFTPFFTTRPTGTGLGLAIAQKITRAHGGELSARSAPGEGSAFTMWVPVKGG